MAGETAIETWKQIAAAVGRCERWCRYMAAREQDPLPVVTQTCTRSFVRADAAALAAWLERNPSTPMAIKSVFTLRREALREVRSVRAGLLAAAEARLKERFHAR